MAQRRFALWPGRTSWRGLISLALLGACTQAPAPPAPPALPSAPVTKAHDPAAVPGLVGLPGPVVAAARSDGPSADAIRPPSVPGGLRATSQSSSEVALAWQPSSSTSGPVAYDIFRDDARVGRSTESRVVDSKLRPGTHYCYSVRAVDAAGRASAPGPVACAQTLDTSPPSPPPGLVATAYPGNEAEISWNPSSDDVCVAGYEVFRGGARVAIVKGTTLREEGLATAEHCWTVKAFDAVGNVSAASDPACVIVPDSTPPTVPLQVNATATGERTVDLAWQPSKDNVAVVRYEILRDGAPALTTRSTAAREQELLPGRHFCFTVRACDAAGNCSLASPEACATTLDLTPPSRPGNLAAVARSDVAVELGWSPSTDAVGVAGYEVRRGDRVLASGIVDTTFTDSALHPGTKYCYGVLAFDATGNGSPPAVACVTTPDLAPPTAPGRPAVVAVSSSELFVGWDPSTDDVGVLGYEVLRSDRVLAPGIVDTTFTDSALHPGTKYCYGVLAFDANGNGSPPAVACVTTPDLAPPTAPGRPAVASVSSSELFVGWDPSTDDVGVLGYEVLRSGEVVGTVRGTHTRDRRLRANREFCYSVRAFDAAGNRSAAAGPVCAVTADPPELSSPSDLRVVRISATEALLQWAPSKQGTVIYRVYGNGTGVVGLTGSNTFNPSGRTGAQPDCYSVAAVDDQGRESPRSREVCARLPPGPVTER